MHIGWPQFLVAVVVLANGGGAMALGFGQIRSSVVLGQPLNLAVPVNLAEGESLGGECASAEVTAGDVKLPAGSVRVRVTQGSDTAQSVLRITTTSAVEEPVLTVTVNAGCPTRMSRTVVLLADPPLVSTATAPVEALPAVARVTPPPAVTSSAPPPPSASLAPRAKRPVLPPRATRTAAPSPAPAQTAAAAPAASAVSRAGAAAPLRQMARAEPRPRLQLDAGQVSLSQAAVLAAQEQASAARATASAAEEAASAAGARLQAMEEIGRAHV